MSRPINFKNKKVLVMGLGRFGGGVGVTRWLVGQGAQVTVIDLKSAQELADSLKQLEQLEKLGKLEIRCGPDSHSPKLLDEHDVMVVNPAVKPSNEFLKLANKKGLQLTTEMNLFFERCPGKIIGITGSNGKETVVRMVEEMLKAVGEKPIVGGNIGRSLLEMIPPKYQIPNIKFQIKSKIQNPKNSKRSIQPNDLVLVELSSFQLERLAWIKTSPQVAVIINITPNHLDWHGTFYNYLQAKANILRWQKNNDTAVLNTADENVKKLADLVRGKLVGVDRVVESLQPCLKVLGRHNLWNATLAAATARALGVADSQIHEGLAKFHGTEHALEFVCERKGVKIYNDSEATSPAATIAALKSFNQSIVLIAGGSDKGVDLRPLVEHLIGKVKTLITIGQTGPKLLTLLDQMDREKKGNKVKRVRAHSLQQAVELGLEHAQSGDILLLSPACASYDMFENLQERGKIFKKLACGQ